MEPINNNAEYLVILTQDMRKIYIDMNDISQIQYNQTVQLEGLEGEYIITLITWKEPLSEPWQVLLHADYQRVWNEFCQKQAKTPQNIEKD